MFKTYIFREERVGKDTFYFEYETNLPFAPQIGINLTIDGEICEIDSIDYDTDGNFFSINLKRTSLEEKYFAECKKNWLECGWKEHK